MTYNYSNTAVETALDGAINSSTTSIVVDSVSGFPVSFPFSLIIDNDELTREVVTVNAVAGTTLTVVRGQDGTAAVAHANDAPVIHGVVARDLQESQDHIDASTSVHGVSGSVVGTTGAQTLTNKTMDGGANTFTNIPGTVITGFDWQDWTPNYNDITVGDGEVVARYRQVGGHVDFKWLFSLGSTSAIGANPIFSLPLAAEMDGGLGLQLPIATGRAFDSSTGDGTVAAAFLTSFTDAILTVLTQLGSTFVDYGTLDTTAPWTWATDDLICVAGSYEVLSS